MFREHGYIPVSSPSTRVRVCFNQLQALIAYLETRPRLAKGDIGSSTEGRREAKLGWQAAAKILNSVNDGARKSASQWSQYWSSYKNKFKAKLKRVSASEGSDSEIRLTSLEQRVKTLLGPSFTAPRPNVQIENDLDIDEQCDYTVDVAVNKVDHDELPTEDGISSLSGSSNEEPSYATVNVIAANDSYDLNTEEPESRASRNTAMQQSRSRRLIRGSVTQSRYRHLNGIHQKLEGLRSNRLYEKAIHKRTLQYMEEKRQEERELFELKKKKLLLEISALENKLLNSYCVGSLIFIPF